MNRVVVAQLGARKHYQEPALFQKWGILERFYTDLYAGNILGHKYLRSSQVYNHLPKIFRKSLERYDPSLEKAQVVHFPLFSYQYSQKHKNASLKNISSVSLWAGQKFAEQIIRHGFGDANTIYGFNSASLELFKYAKSQGMRCILDQTLAERSYVYELLLEEEKSWKEWSKLAFKVSNTDLQLAEREHQEQQIADKIICGSEFVKDSLIRKGIEPARISVVSLGRLKEGKISDVTQKIVPQDRGDGLRILFAGTVNLRKGIPYLLQALQELKGQIPFTCKIAGSIEIKSERIAEYQDVCEFLGRVPRSQMAELYQWADVFVLPSICEGSAMVTYEAINWGVPVITTYNSGSIIRDQIDGFIIPIRNSNIITEKLLTIYQGRHHKISLEDNRKYFSRVYQEAENLLNKSILVS